MRRKVASSVEVPTILVKNYQMATAPLPRRTPSQVNHLGKHLFFKGLWRRRRDSNPRDPSGPTPLAGERLRPLGHVSADPYMDQATGKQGLFTGSCRFFPRSCFCRTSQVFAGFSPSFPCNPCKIRAACSLLFSRQGKISFATHIIVCNLSAGRPPIFP